MWTDKSVDWIRGCNGICPIMPKWILQWVWETKYGCRVLSRTPVNVSQWMIRINAFLQKITICGIYLDNFIRDGGNIWKPDTPAFYLGCHNEFAKTLRNMTRACGRGTINYWRGAWCRYLQILYIPRSYILLRPTLSVDFVMYRESMALICVIVTVVNAQGSLELQRTLVKVERHYTTGVEHLPLDN